MSSESSSIKPRLERVEIPAHQKLVTGIRSATWELTFVSQILTQPSAICETPEKTIANRIKQIKKHSQTKGAVKEVKELGKIQRFMQTYQQDIANLRTLRNSSEAAYENLTNYDRRSKNIIDFFVTGDVKMGAVDVSLPADPQTRATARGESSHSASSSSSSSSGPAPKEEAEITITRSERKSSKHRTTSHSSSHLAPPPPIRQELLNTLYAFLVDCDPKNKFHIRREFAEKLKLNRVEEQLLVKWLEGRSKKQKQTNFDLQLFSCKTNIRPYLLEKLYSLLLQLDPCYQLVTLSIVTEKFQLNENEIEKLGDALKNRQGNFTKDLNPLDLIDRKINIRPNVLDKLYSIILDYDPKDRIQLLIILISTFALTQQEGERLKEALTQIQNEEIDQLKMQWKEKHNQNVSGTEATLREKWDQETRQLEQEIVRLKQEKDERVGQIRSDMEGRPAREIRDAIIQFEDEQFEYRDNLRQALRAKQETERQTVNAGIQEKRKQFEEITIKPLREAAEYDRIQYSEASNSWHFDTREEDKGLQPIGLYCQTAGFRLFDSGPTRLFSIETNIRPYLLDKLHPWIRDLDLENKLKIIDILTSQFQLNEDEVNKLKNNLLIKKSYFAHETHALDFIDRTLNIRPRLVDKLHASLLECAPEDRLQMLILDISQSALTKEEGEKLIANLTEDRSKEIAAISERKQQRVVQNKENIKRLQKELLIEWRKEREPLEQEIEKWTQDFDRRIENIKRVIFLREDREAQIAIDKLIDEKNKEIEPLQQQLTALRAKQQEECDSLNTLIGEYLSEENQKFNTAMDLRSAELQAVDYDRIRYLEDTQSWFFDTRQDAGIQPILPYSQYQPARLGQIRANIQSKISADQTYEALDYHRFRTHVRQGLKKTSPVAGLDQALAAVDLG